jgi:hypothetical protein
MLRVCLPILTLLIGSSLSLYAADEKSPPEKKSREQLEKEFAEMFSGSVLTGRFTIDGKETPPKEEKYTILEAKKLQGDLWILNTRMQYGDKDATFPITIPIKWSGDTPVITLTNFTIPGMGTFSSRVLIYEGRYAGTWQHGEVGGCMFGRITKATPPETPPAAK